MTPQEWKVEARSALKLALEELKHIKKQCLHAMGVSMVDERILAVVEEVLMSHSDGAQPAVPQGHEQEPVALVIDGVVVKSALPEKYTGHLYTTPPQRPSRSDIKPLTSETCKWQQSDDVNMPDTWEASCGAIWTFTEGGPKDNDMHYCPKCGKPAIEKAAHGITEE